MVPCHRSVNFLSFSRCTALDDHNCHSTPAQSVHHGLPGGEPLSVHRHVVRLQTPWAVLSDIERGTVHPMHSVRETDPETMMDMNISLNLQIMLHHRIWQFFSYPLDMAGEVAMVESVFERSCYLSSLQSSPNLTSWPHST